MRVKRFCRKGGMRRERPCIIRVKKKKERDEDISVNEKKKIPAFGKYSSWGGKLKIKSRHN